MPQALKLAGRASLLARCLPELVQAPAQVTEAPKTLAQVIEAPKTLAQMPGPGALSFFYDLFCRRGLSRLHELQVSPVPEQPGMHLAPVPGAPQVARRRLGESSH